MLESLCRGTLSACAHVLRSETAHHLRALPGRQRLAVDYCVVEAVLGELFRLPVAPHKWLFYGATLVELCHMDELNVSPALTLATQLLYERLAAMDRECRERFAQWLAYHLSQFGFQWTWHEWALDVSESGADSAIAEDDRARAVRRDWLRSLLAHCVRLSYDDRLRQILPPPLIALLPPKSERSYAFADPAAPHAAAAATLLDAYARKVPADELEQLLTELVPDSSPPADADVRLRLFMQTVLHAGSKSYTHMVTYMERYATVLPRLGADTAGRVAMLREIYSMFGDTQTALLAFDKLLSMGVVDCEAMLEWSVAPAVRPILAAGYACGLRVASRAGRLMRRRAGLSACRD